MSIQRWRTSRPDAPAHFFFAFFLPGAFFLAALTLDLALAPAFFLPPEPPKIEDQPAANF